MLSDTVLNLTGFLFFCLFGLENCWLSWKLNLAGVWFSFICWYPGKFEGFSSTVLKLTGFLLKFCNFFCLFALVNSGLSKLNLGLYGLWVWQYGLSSFQGRGTNIFGQKSTCVPRKSLYFDKHSTEFSRTLSKSNFYMENDQNLFKTFNEQYHYSGAYF